MVSAHRKMCRLWQFDVTTFLRSMHESKRYFFSSISLNPWDNNLALQSKSMSKIVILIFNLYVSQLFQNCSPTKNVPRNLKPIFYWFLLHIPLPSTQLFFWSTLIIFLITWWNLILRVLQYRFVTRITISVREFFHISHSYLSQ